MKRIVTVGKALTAVLLAVTLAGCERPPMDSTQTGYRGTAMGQVSNPRIVEPLRAAQTLPDPIPEVPSPPGSPLAKDTFKNVQVLGDLPAGEFTRTMLAITAWVSPKEGCNYCHAPGEDLSSDKLYTKLVARKMLSMTRGINANWKEHVANTGVTCYTCHRGQPVPSQVWFNQLGPRHAGGASAESDGHNSVSRQAGLTALDVNVVARYLVANEPLRAAGTQALPYGNPATIKQTENTFGLMIHMSESLGVNCTFCHNTRSHAQWAESPLQRTTAYHGIRMVRELNNQYMLPLTDTFPANRLGPTGDVAKVSCATCHQGVNKPLGGAPLIQAHPALATLAAAAAAATPAMAGGDGTAGSGAVPVAVPVSERALKPATAAARASDRLVSVHFARGTAAIDADGVQAIAEAATALKGDAMLAVSLSGYADQTGDANANLDLARRRASAVRDALQAAGVDAARIQLRKPEFVIGGADADARRVDIDAQS